MARENRQTRDRKRFGEPQLLADRIHELKTLIPAGQSREVSDACYKRSLAIFAEVATSAVVTCDEVSEYFFQVQDASAFDWTRDIPCWRPPFKRTFLECKRPSTYLPGQSFPGDFPVRWGWLITETAPTESVYARVRSRPGCEDAKINSVLRASLIEEFPDHRTHVDIGTLVLPIDYDGKLLGGPQFEFDATVPITREGTLRVASRARTLAAPVLLSLAFMSCQNVRLIEVEPDKSINRERKRHDRRPFVDFRTIEIDAFRTILKTEGRVNEVGLAEALHMVRGHFVRYTEDKPMFGKFSGRFWVPAHTRGSAENGVIVADYRVNRPA